MKYALSILSFIAVAFSSTAYAKAFDEQTARAQLAEHIAQKSEIEQDFYNRLFERELFKGTFRNNRWRFNIIRWMDLVWETELGKKHVAYLLNDSAFPFSKGKELYPEEMTALERGESLEQVVAIAKANEQYSKTRFFPRYLANAQEYVLLRRFNNVEFEFTDLIEIEKKINQILESTSDFKFHGATNQEKGHALDDEKLYRYYYKWAKTNVGPPNGELFGRSFEEFQDYYATYMTAMSKDQFSFGLNKWNRASRDIQEYWTKAKGDPARLTPYEATSFTVQNQSKSSLASKPTVMSSTPSEVVPEEPEKVIEDKLDEAIDTVIEEPKKKLKKLFGF
jgi:hypothetical protein